MDVEQVGGEIVVSEVPQERQITDKMVTAARGRADKVRKNFSQAWRTIFEMKQKEDWYALGYENFLLMCMGEFHVESRQANNIINALEVRNGVAGLLSDGAQSVLDRIKDRAVLALRKLKPEDAAAIVEGFAKEGVIPSEDDLMNEIPPQQLTAKQLVALGRVVNDHNSATDWEKEARKAIKVFYDAFIKLNNAQYFAALGVQSIDQLMKQECPQIGAMFGWYPEQLEQSEDGETHWREQNIMDDEDENWTEQPSLLGDENGVE